jgi:hypothetical protein
MKYVVVMDSGDMIYITKFHEHWFSHSEIGGGRGYTYRHKHRQEGIS